MYYLCLSRIKCILGGKTNKQNKTKQKLGFSNYIKIDGLTEFVNNAYDRESNDPPRLLYPDISSALAKGTL